MRAKRGLRRLGIAALVTVLVAGAAVGAGALIIMHLTDSVQQTSLLGGAAVGAEPTGSNAPYVISQRNAADGPVNILLAGIDERVADPEGGARSDSIIIVHVPAAHDHAYLISIPRDSRVTIPAYARTGYRGGTDKINAAFSYGSAGGGGRQGGFELLALTVKNLTGLSFNAGAIVNFDGLRAVVDAVGGVTMCVDEETTSVHIGWDARGNETMPYHLVPPDYHPVRIPGIRPQVYHVGCQHLAGWQALDYVRQRDLIPDGDYGRQRHQQQLIDALAGKFSTAGLLGNPLGADRALTALGNAVSFDGNGASLLDWMFTLHAITPSAITMLKTNAGTFSTQVIGGQDFEILNATTTQLFAAAADDTLDRFVAAHPDWVN